MYDEDLMQFRLGLKSMEDADIVQLWKVIKNNKDSLRPWLDWVDLVQSQDEYRSYMERVKYEQSIGIQKQIILTVDDVAAGEIVFEDFDARVRSCMMGYWLNPELHNQGIMTSACTRAINMAFESLNIDKVNVRFISDNTASHKLASKLGFKLDGVLRKNILYHGQIRDEIIMSLFADEWKAWQKNIHLREQN